MWRKWVLLLLGFTIVKSDIPPLNLLQYQNFTVADTNTICSYFSTANISEKCREQLAVVCGNTTLLMTMLDASAKFPYPGLLYSTRMDYGNFDQCLSIDHHHAGGRILGEYCTVGLVIPDILGNVTDADAAYKLALCRPDACSASDFNAVIADVLSTPLQLFLDGSCVTVESNTTFTAGDIATLSIFIIVIVLMFVSTTYDTYLYIRGAKSVHPLLLSFSVLSNGRKLLHISEHSPSKEQIETFHGIRVISMMWIVAGHAMVMWQNAVVTNIDRVNTFRTEMYATYITASPLAVDTFFFMSGFLLAFQYFRGKVRSLEEQVLSVPYIIVHRYIRITPAMAMVYLVTITLFIHTGSGPIWTELNENNIDLCTAGWWKFFLYIQNYFNMDDICLVQTWYLSADMQLFLLSPIILIPLSLQLKKMGFKVVMLELILWDIIWTFVPMVAKLTFRDYLNYYDTHTRAINYFVGMTLGFFMRMKIDEPFLYMINRKLRFITNLITWPVMIIGMLATIFCYQDEQLHHGYVSGTVFDALMRPAWCIGLSWITYSCYHGQGGFVNWILCRPIFQVLAKLTYCIYLTHMAVIMYHVGTARTKWYFTDYNAFYQFCGHYVMALVLATFWTLAFESPLIIIEKFLLGGAKKPSTSKLTQNGKTDESLTVAA